MTNTSLTLIEASMPSNLKVGESLRKLRAMLSASSAGYPTINRPRPANGSARWAADCWRPTKSGPT